MRRLEGHTKDVRAVCFMADGRVASGGSDRSVRVWHPSTGECVHTIKAGRVVYAVAASPDGGTLAYGGRAREPREMRNEVLFWDVHGQRVREVFEWRMTGWAVGSIWSLSFSAAGDYLAAACRVPGASNMLNGGGGRWWRRSGRVAEGDLPGKGVYALTFAPTGTTLAVTRERAVYVLEGPEGSERLNHTLQAAWAGAVTFVSPGDTVVIGASSYLHFISVAASVRPVRVKSALRSVNALAASPDGRTLLAGGRPGTVEMYDAETRMLRASFDFDLGAIHALAFSPDGVTFAAAGDGGLAVCDVG